MDNTEIELKFRAHKFNKNKFLSFLNEFPILSDSIKNIQNTYFDTDEFLLGRQKAGLRIRKVNVSDIQCFFDNQMSQSQLYCNFISIYFHINKIHFSVKI